MRCTGWLLVGATLLAPSLEAQVGRPPGESPYRTVLYPMSFTVNGGVILGGRGKVQVGPSAARTLGGRGEIRLSGLVSAAFSFTYADAERFIQDPSQPVDTRKSGPVSQTVIMADAGLVFNLTGQKTWNRIAPYIGLGLGGTWANNTPEEVTPYDFGFKFAFHPAIGARVYASERVFLRLEARDLIWRLKYPAAFQAPPTEFPDLPSVLPEGSGNTQWVHHWFLTVGLGWSFRL